MDHVSAITGAATLSHWGVIRAQGDDAAKFLHGQLTQDFALLDGAHARLAAFCSAKGRMQASFVAWKPAHDEVLLACAASVLAATLERLSMFVLRARCKLSDATDGLLLQGVVGEPVEALLGDAAAWQRRERDGATLIRLPDALGAMRALCVSPRLGADPAAGFVPMSLESWRWLEIHSGVPTIEAATVDRFVPQMLNFELLGGVDFKKGCYPGQEIVARSQYRGSIKRRMFMFEVEAHASAGQEIFDSADPDQPAGMVVQAATLQGAARSSALVEVKLSAIDAGHGLHLGAPDGPVLERGALPYDLPREATVAG